MGCEQRLGDFEPVQVWIGYLENYSPSSQSRVELRFAQMEKNNVAGQARSGTGPWKAGYEEPPTDVFDDLELVPSHPMDTGFVYSIVQGRLENGRLRFFVELAEPWCAYCGGLPSIDLLNGEYACYPTQLHGGKDREGCFVESPAEVRVPWACETMEMCGATEICGCAKAGCTATGLMAPLKSAYSMALDVTIESPSLARGSVDSFSVRFDIDARGTAAAPGAAGTGNFAAAGASSAPAQTGPRLAGAGGAAGAS